MFRDDYVGLLLIGDPHIEARQPGFRKDDFPQTILKKIEWCLSYCEQEKLLPAFLGDLFDKPRGNPNWLIARLIEIMSRVDSIGIYGNHDCAETELDENDSLSILIAAGCMRLISEATPFRTRIADRDVIVGGSSYRAPIPTTFHLPNSRAQGLFENDPFVLWLTHHDIGFPGYNNPRIEPHQIENVDLLVNGHIHRKLESVKAGRTLWMTPGNITRRSRSDAVREHIPCVTRIDVQSEDYKISSIEIPHQPFEDVFHELVLQQDEQKVDSDFVSGLAELTSRKTDSGAGLHQFLTDNVKQFEPSVADVIMQLATEITESEKGDAHV